jgi:ABC-type antimicrobial peptide transport system permease subunit
VLLVNETLARREFAGANPIGRHVYAGADSVPWEIVGVVADVRQTAIDREPGAQVFVLHSQWPGNVVFVLGPYFAIRATDDPSAILPTVSAVVRSLESDAGLFNVATMDQIVSNRMSRPRMYATLFGVFAAIAVVLAAIGVYGVIACLVSRRTREIGIRMALGARRSQVVGLVCAQSAAWYGLGLGAGLAGAAALSKYLESLLFGITPLDRPTFAAVPIVLVVAAALAAFVPARRATRVNPLVALREE